MAGPSRFTPKRESLESRERDARRDQDGVDDVHDRVDREDVAGTNNGHRLVRAGSVAGQRDDHQAAYDHAVKYGLVTGDPAVDDAPSAGSDDEPMPSALPAIGEGDGSEEERSAAGGNAAGSHGSRSLSRSAAPGPSPMKHEDDADYGVGGDMGE